MESEALQKYFLYLNKLRDSGKVNMFGAVPHLMKQFSLDRENATDIWSKWIDQF
jgi:hypothetical protein